jgi:hypothetical protein
MFNIPLAVRVPVRDHAPEDVTFHADVGNWSSGVLFCPKVVNVDATFGKPAMLKNAGSDCHSSGGSSDRRSLATCVAAREYDHASSSRCDRTQHPQYRP